jgi:hypothetical protein
MILRSVRTATVIMTIACFALGIAPAVGAVEPPFRAEGRTGALALATITLYSQPPEPAGGLYQSSRNGSDYDRYVWDDFMLPSSLAISEIRWRGGFDPARFGSGGPVLDFAVAIYASNPGGTGPNVPNPPLVEYSAGGNAGQTPAGTFGGVAMYDYSFTLPTPFQATAGAKYWVQIEASQNGIPDWGISAGTGGNGQHFLQYAAVGDVYYATVAGDAAFTLLGPGRATYFPFILR